MVVVTRRGAHSTSPSISDKQYLDIVSRTENDLPNLTYSVPNNTKSAISKPPTQKSKLVHVSESSEEGDRVATSDEEDSDEATSHHKQRLESQLDNVKEKLREFESQYQTLMSDYETIENKFKTSFESLNKSTARELGQVWSGMDKMKAELLKTKNELQSVRATHTNIASSGVAKKIVAGPAQPAPPKHNETSMGKHNESPPPKHNESPPPKHNESAAAKHNESPVGIVENMAKALISAVYSTTHPSHPDNSGGTSSTKSKSANKIDTTTQKKVEEIKAPVKIVDKSVKEVAKKRGEEIKPVKEVAKQTSKRSSPTKKNRGRSTSSSRSKSSERRERSRSSERRVRSKSSKSRGRSTSSSMSSSPPPKNTKTPPSVSAKKASPKPSEMIKTRSRSGSPARPAVGATLSQTKKPANQDSPRRTSPRNAKKIQTTAENFGGLDMTTTTTYHDDDNDDDDSDDSDDVSISSSSEKKVLCDTPNKLFKEDEDGVCGWGSELSDSDLPQGKEASVSLAALDRSEDEDGDTRSEGGVHSELHELIDAIGNLVAPTHEILDEIWLKLPQVDGVNYPTKSNIPNEFDRQAELLKMMIVLYEKVSTVAMQTMSSPDDIYTNRQGAAFRSFL